MKIQSTSAKVPFSVQKVYDFLSTPSLYEKLMPERVVFSSNENSFNFQQNGMPPIAVRLKSQTAPEKIVWEADGGSIAFELSVLLQSQESFTQVCFVFQGQLNAMLQMMVKKPLANLLETFITNLSQQNFV